MESMAMVAIYLLSNTAGRREDELSTVFSIQSKHPKAQVCSPILQRKIYMSVVIHELELYLHVQACA
jgi:hypothetical protein